MELNRLVEAFSAGRDVTLNKSTYNQRIADDVIFADFDNVDFLNTSIHITDETKVE